MVLNYQSSYESGSHYYAIRVIGKNMIVFDSLGFPPDQPIIDYCKVNKLKIITNKQRIQSDKSHYCGHYCLLFLKNVRGDCHTQLALEIDKFYKNFNLKETPTALKANDQKIKDLIN